MSLLFSNRKQKTSLSPRTSKPIKDCHSPTFGKPPSSSSGLQLSHYHSSSPSPLFWAVCSVYKKLSNYFPKRLYHLMLPLAMYEGSSFSTSLPAFDVVSLFITFININSFPLFLAVLGVRCCAQTFSLVAASGGSSVAAGHPLRFSSPGPPGRVAPALRNLRKKTSTCSNDWTVT